MVVISLIYGVVVADLHTSPRQFLRAASSDSMACAAPPASPDSPLCPRCTGSPQAGCRGCAPGGPPAPSAARGQFRSGGRRRGSRERPSGR